MENLTASHIIGALVTLIIIMGIGVYSGKRVKNASDFSTGGHRASSLLVAGTIIGTLVGGSSTVGTAQLAYNYGFSAWWFTLGAGLGCLILGSGFVKPLKLSCCNTIQEMISSEYGQTSGIITTVLSSFGIILNIVAQILAANALLSSMFGLDSVESACVSILLMSVYVIFGGVLSTGILGIIKLVLIYFSVFLGAAIALKLGGGFSGFYNNLNHQQYFNLVSRGVGIDVGDGFSVVLGVLSTQTYIQAVISGKNIKEAKKGALLSAAIIPPIGIGSILIGMYMKINYPYIESSQAFPLFIINNIPPFISGLILATLLIALVGTGSGMALGFSTIIINDIYKKYISKNENIKNELVITRIVILLTLVVSAIFTLGNLKTAILTWGFMSMGLRATVLIIPMIGALFFKGKIGSKFAVLSSVFGFLSFLVCETFFDLNMNSLFIGVSISALTILFGLSKHHKIQQ
ncbi:sodium:solute symporter family protein [Sedimentibacter hydroxybenzoicus DSM 7310]|uniref:Sodium:solute symporter family protein n=1 Tax=Sedimentibacter hydroxybenzoicus DSM 7310 TaxID=1123245 RepID=A0A974GW11_SEDHY|nr:sodium:solute symporter family protein [Sedimentibacter hydroxybenzoicus]NYB73987.1 sodium:solute symporter family protein [Sedimentibacter hydroxybenzoicus DSM 7310]